MNRKGIFTLLLIALLPMSASAAGFAKQSLFLSRQSVTEGETVLIHAVVSNEAAAAFAGTLTLADAGVAVGSVPVRLGAGESSVVSVSWKPAAGSHPLSAELKDQSGTVIESQKETFSIAGKPAAASSSRQLAAVESSRGIQDAISSLSPAAENYAEPVFGAIDSARNSVADALDSQLASVKTKLAPGAPGEVLGAEAVQNSTKNPGGALWYLLNTMLFYLLTLVRFIIGSAGVFYPLCAALFFYILWRTFKRFRRPAY